MRLLDLGGFEFCVETGRRALILCSKRIGDASRIREPERATTSRGRAKDGLNLTAPCGSARGLFCDSGLAPAASFGFRARLKASDPFGACCPDCRLDLLILSVVLALSLYGTGTTVLLGTS